MQRTFTCLYCGATAVIRRNKHRPRKYCSYTCQNARQREDKMLDGRLEARSAKRILLDERGRQCWRCGLSEWMGKPITLELDHIDGHNGRNERSNLQILCPNCHAQTDTYKSKNLGRGPISRRTALDSRASVVQLGQGREPKGLADT